jgi:hypothetical protein
VATAGTIVFIGVTAALALALENHRERRADENYTADMIAALRPKFGAYIDRLRDLQAANRDLIHRTAELREERDAIK